MQKNLDKLLKKPIYMGCHESFHTPEQNSQLNCTRKKNYATRLDK
jgi:urease beta subunit